MVYSKYNGITNGLSTPNERWRVIRVLTLNSFHHQSQPNVSILVRAWRYLPFRNCWFHYQIIL